MVAVSNFDTYPPETARLPHLGNLDTLSLERLAAVKPDLVVMNDVQAPFLEQPLKDLGLRIFKISNQSIQQTFAAMTAMGRVTGNERQAATLVAATRAGLDRVSRRMTGVGKPSVVLIVDRTPGTLRELYTATAGSYLAELVAIAGGRISVPADPHGYRRLTEEELLALNPDIILDFLQAANSRFAGNRLAGNPMDAWQEMPELKAVRLHRVYDVNEDFVPHASQRMVQTAELFAKRIHPEIQ